ncbi:DEAD/DEAH box helicase [Pseudomonas congelans]|uniref:SNF2-related protein n=1 Tax=Pseudomonas congelans TaxID=200452 RepID=UPI001F1665FF|nr:SNF2-related protein [Pseudomonas congelans]MCF5166861.1 DEAD/DEAH box helicase [Pseudomonas congelans]
MYTDYQRAYLAHWLALSRSDEQALTKAIASARVDMNPHQVDAALFALKSPLSKGVILADEVGLGKTIEASLVLAQKWAEQRRRLLLIVPATLRKQWQQELFDKFALPSKILEAKDFNEAKKAGLSNPFDREMAGDPAIVICSYEFAARKEVELARVPWNLVVFDEAHRLRNIYKNDGAKIAKALNDALIGCPKMLLSATPLQNSLLELYGLVSVVDPHLFGDLQSFKARYGRPRVDDAELELLRHRLQSICKRTLRRQVQEEGGINFTRRYSMTSTYVPKPNETKLYELVSEYLQDERNLAIKPQARHLVTLVVRKILASSTRALRGTLQRMIERLEQKASLAEALADYEELGDLSDASGTEDEDFIDPTALQSEIDRLKGFLALADSISSNAKCDELLTVLEKAFDFAQRLGGERKAVIFTESVRTQAWLLEQLTAAGYGGRVVLLNGTNNDKDSLTTLQAWQQRHAGSSRVSGSRTADMKAALVERFRDQASIMICTEAGAEGINLQFCSLLINYDLPWNPQRVEQRIGRVHRYGQKHDVVVVNFINGANKADVRVFELLSKKFNLFEGVFGASDEILGAIESGVDIEQRIHAIYQKCRSNDEIEREFDQLQEQLQAQIESRNHDARRSLLEHFDVDVIKRLNMRREQTENALDEYQKHLLLLARMSLPDANFAGQRFELDGQWYDPDWQSVEQTESQFLQANDGLGKKLIEQAISCRQGGIAEVIFQYAPADNGQYSNLLDLLNHSGELAVEKLVFDTPKQQYQHLLLTGLTDQQQLLDQRTCERLLSLLGDETDGEPTIQHDLDLEANLEVLRAGCLSEAHARNERFFEEETEKLERWAEDKRIGLDIRVKQLDQEIKEARKAVRQLETLQEKMSAKRALKKLERERDDLLLAYHEEKKKIEEEEDRLLEDIEENLEISISQERLFTLRWRLEASA